MADLLTAILLRLTPSQDSVAPRAAGLPSVDLLDDQERRRLERYVGREAINELRLLNQRMDRSGDYVPMDEDIQIVVLALIRADFPPAEEPISERERLSTKNLQDSVAGYWRFVVMVTKHQRDIATYMRDEAYPDGDLFVHHLMDMAVAYGGNEPTNPFLKQNEIFTTLDRATEGRVAHFSAFDPLRRDQALPLAQRFWAESGALGFKVYPPSGYRPAGNVRFPPKPCFLRFSARKQWNWRYRGWSPEQLNATLDGFFAWAEANKVPIFTHCTPWGFEAVKGYGLMGDPTYWAQVLEDHPDLILCFGHAGGGYFWFNEKPAAGDPTCIDNVPVQDVWRFGEEVAKLCLEYPNVYAELGYHTELFKEGGIDAAYNRLAGLIELSAKGKDWQLGDKLAYGTDWLMMHKTDGFKDYPFWWNEVFQRLDSRSGVDRAWRARFFAGNALRFLSLEKRLDDPRFESAKEYWTGLLERVAQAEAR